MCAVHPRSGELLAQRDSEEPTADGVCVSHTDTELHPRGDLTPPRSPGHLLPVGSCQWGRGSDSPRWHSGQGRPGLPVPTAALGPMRHVSWPSMTDRCAFRAGCAVTGPSDRRCTKVLLLHREAGLQQASVPRRGGSRCLPKWSLGAAGAVGTAGAGPPWGRGLGGGRRCASGDRTCPLCSPSWSRETALMKEQRELLCPARWGQCWHPQHPLLYRDR